jgi:hypothetical protein
MASVWIRSVHNLHCPTCDARLVERGERFVVRERRTVMYVGDVGTQVCRNGHALPDRESLYSYRDAKGHPRSAPVSEVSAPHPALSFQDS